MILTGISGCVSVLSDDRGGYRIVFDDSVLDLPSYLVADIVKSATRVTNAYNEVLSLLKHKARRMRLHLPKKKARSDRNWLERRLDAHKPFHFVQEDVEEIAEPLLAVSTTDMCRFSLDRLTINGERIIEHRDKAVEALDDFEAWAKPGMREAPAMIQTLKRELRANDFKRFSLALEHLPRNDSFYVSWQRILFYTARFVLDDTHLTITVARESASETATRHRARD